DADTQPYNKAAGGSTLANDQWAPPRQYTPTSPQRRVWPWLLALACVLLLGFGIIVAITVVAPQLIQTKSKGPAPTPGWSPLSSPSASRSPTNESDVPTDYDE